MKKSENRTRWLHLRLSESEYQQLQTSFSGTTERKLSTYSRKILLGKPVIGGYRNLSADELIAELSRLNKDLNGVANNFNQAVHVLHTLQDNAQFSRWLAHYQSQQVRLLSDISRIREFIRQNAELWLQS